MGIPGLQILEEFAAIARRAEGLSVRMRKIPNLGRVFDLPGGAFVLGSVALGQFPHWVAVSPFAVPEKVVTEAFYQRIMGKPGLKGALPEYPVTNVSWNNGAEFYRIWNERHGDEVPGEIYGFARHPESEFAIRGPAVDREWMMARMKTKGIPRNWDGFCKFVRDRIENVVTQLGGYIITDLTGGEMRVLFDSGAPFSGWRVFGTDEGNIRPGVNAWVRQKALTRADWGPPNGWRTEEGKGPLRMAGGVWEWLGDLEGGYPRGGIHVNPRGPENGTYRVFGGGGSRFDGPGLARAADRPVSPPDDASVLIGLRGVLRPQGS